MHRQLTTHTDEQRANRMIAGPMGRRTDSVVGHIPCLCAEPLNPEAAIIP